jgi:hypothetical protein
MTAKESFLVSVDHFSDLESLTEPLHDMFMAYCFRHAENFAHNNSNDIAAYNQIRNMVIEGWKFAREEAGVIEHQ